MTILFKKHHVPLILEGRKRQTRRMWKRCRVKVGSLHWASTSLFKKDARFARLRVEDVWKEKLIVISLKDARAEGYESPQGFFMGFAAANGLQIEDVDLQQEVWCVEFQVVGGPDR